MTNANYIKWLERMIVGCDDLGGMEREKAIYQNCLKKARNLGQTLPIQCVCDECGDTGRGKPTLQEPDGIDCEKCSSK